MQYILQTSTYIYFECYFNIHLCVFFKNQDLKTFSNVFEYFWIESCNFSFSSVQSFSHVQLFVMLWAAAHQASLSITNSRSLLKLMSIESVMPSNHLILCHPLLLLSSIFPSNRVFSIESFLHIKRPKYWSFSLS